MMKIELSTNTQTSFQAKVSPKFINSMRGFVNNGENRLKNNYRLTQKGAVSRPLILRHCSRIILIYSILEGCPLLNFLSSSRLS